MGVVGRECWDGDPVRWLAEALHHLMLAVANAPPPLQLYSATT